MIDVEEYYEGLQGCTISEVENRGISVKQLKHVYEEIVARCEVEEWRNYKDDVLTPEEVTLYDIKEKIIISRSKEKLCSYVERIATGPQKPTKFMSHFWGDRVCSMIYCLDQYIKDRGLSEDNTFFWICVSNLTLFLSPNIIVNFISLTTTSFNIILQIKICF